MEHSLKNEKYKPYIAWGLTAFVTIVLSISFFFALFKIGDLHAFGQTLSRILRPISIGAVLAYILTPVYNHLRRLFLRGFSQIFEHERAASKLASGLSIAISLALVLVVVYGLVAMVVPEVISSIMGIAGNYDLYFQRISSWITEFMENDTVYAPMVKTTLENLQDYLSNWIDNTLLLNLKDYIYNLSIGVSTGVVRIVGVLIDLLIGLIVTAYLLGCKDTLCAQSKKAIYGVFKLPIANLIVRKCRYAHRVFGGFINGKLLDSLIIGVICFACCSIMKIPYAMLVSVVVGVTNIIPFFGPFIGAIPSTFLILLNSPLKALYFVIFILILQQFDGNILGPKILGNSTGLSSFWVLFSILLFGGLFGFVGMIIGIPLFAVIYSLVNDLVNYGLKSKNLSTETEDYQNLECIQEDDHQYCELEKRISLRKQARNKAKTHSSKGKKDPPQQ